MTDSLKPSGRLNARLNKNFLRLSGKLYRENCFRPTDYDWSGDWEGRALLAFVSLYKATSRAPKYLKKYFTDYNKHCNARGYFGLIGGGVIREEQLSGHSWLLRGLIEHYEAFGDKRSLEKADIIVNDLYLPLADKIGDYPLSREDTGGVSGQTVQVQNGFELSSDTGCIFMCIDGLAHYYAVTKDGSTYGLIVKLIAAFAAIDALKCKFQTHAFLSATRGILAFYKATGEEKYLSLAKKNFAVYEENGMTLTYQNYNWFCRPEWTEPCAIVDSFMVASSLYEYTKEIKYLSCARRIYYNGFASAQRSNGGAGTDCCVTKSFPLHYAKMYEATFCCTMRLSEGLFSVADFAFSEGELRLIEDGDYAGSDFSFTVSGDYPYGGETVIEVTSVSKPSTLKIFTGGGFIEYLIEKPCKICLPKNDEISFSGGIYTKGELVLGEVVSRGVAYRSYLNYDALFKVDGHILQPIVLKYLLPKSKAKGIKQKIVF